MIPHSRPRLGAAFEDAVMRVLASGHIAAGAEADMLEHEVAQTTGCKQAVAVDSGTSALKLALLAIKLDHPLRRVGIPAYTCRAVLHAVRAAGAQPVCMDCGDALRLDQEKAHAVANALDAVVLVHPFGLVEPMVAEAWPCPVIEDIATAAGGCLHGKALGAFGDIGVVSFYATKPWGGAAGGMILSGDAAMCERIRSMRNADRAAPSLPYAGNHQLSDLHAALVRVRLGLVTEERQQRMALAQRFDAWFTDSSASPVPRQAQGNHYRYIVRTQGKAEETIAALHAEGIGAARPIEATLSSLMGNNDCPGAEAAWRDCVSLPLLVDLDEEEYELMKKVVQACM